MTNDSYETLEKPLWVPRPVNETLKIYAEWAAGYDADVTNAGYATPDRVAAALKQFLPTDARILDFGCGTGLSGKALFRAGFMDIDGVDISPQMLDIAHGAGCYQTLWQGTPGTLTGVAAGDYAAIIAAGVISLGAAPPETLSLLLDHAAPGTLLAFSFNQPTVDDGSYDAQLQSEITAGRGTVVFRETGPHLPGKNMNSDVIVLKRL